MPDSIQGIQFPDEVLAEVSVQRRLLEFDEPSLPLCLAVDNGQGQVCSHALCFGVEIRRPALDAGEFTLDP
ncbi:MAG: hypothetical protein AAF624_07720 [Bacteroidota bacterium]